MDRRYNICPKNYTHANPMWSYDLSFPHTLNLLPDPFYFPLLRHKTAQPQINQLWVCVQVWHIFKIFGINYRIENIFFVFNWWLFSITTLHVSFYMNYLPYQSTVHILFLYTFFIASIPYTAQFIALLKTSKTRICYSIFK